MRSPIGIISYQSVQRTLDGKSESVSNGFLQEFNNAKINLAARGGASFAPNSAASPCAACVATPILDKFFGTAAGAPTVVAAGTAYGSSTFISNLNNNNVGAMASTLAFNAAYRLNRESTVLGLPSNFFVANPNASFARVCSMIRCRTITHSR